MHIGEAVQKATALMREQQWSDAIVLLHDLLNRRMDDPGLLLLMGGCHQALDNDGLAYSLYVQALQLKPDYVEVMTNMAQMLRSMGKHKEEVGLWDEIERIEPGNKDRVSHIPGTYLNNATPVKAEELAREHLEILGDTPQGNLQLGLALLEQERFAEGFDHWDKTFDSNKRKTRNFWTLGQTPVWDGSPGMNVVVYGEQGHGDEIMFASCMEDVFARCNQVIIDTSKSNMVQLYERSFPEAVVLCTPDSQVNPHHSELQIDAMIAFGSLPGLFRRTASEFPEHAGYIKAHPAKKLEMRRRLDALGDGPKIGLAWSGGIKSTHSCYRQVKLEDLSPLLKQDAHFISVQYTRNAAAQVSIQQDTTGVQVHHWQAAIDDFDMLTALIDELDLLISVPQTAVHQRAALGKECWVLMPHKAPWTFGLNRENNIWYQKQTRYFNQTEHDAGNWVGAIFKAANALSEITGSKPGKVHVPAPVEVEQINRAVGM